MFAVVAARVCACACGHSGAGRARPGAWLTRREAGGREGREGEGGGEGAGREQGGEREGGEGTGGGGVVPAVRRRRGASCEGARGAFARLLRGQRPSPPPRRAQAGRAATPGSSTCTTSLGAEAGDQAARCGGDRRHRGRAFAEVRRGDKPPREVVDVERPTEDARAHARRLRPRPCMVSPMTQPGKARAAEAAHSPSNIPSVPSVVYVASPRSSPRAAAPWWWGRSAVSVRPCVRVSVRPRVRPASLPVSPVRPVLLLKTTCEKKKKEMRPSRYQ